jgi:predicted O-methyltransferase YrrM
MAGRKVSPVIAASRSDRLFAANRAFLDEANALDPDLATAEAIEGLIHPREGLLLYVLARRSAHLGDIVEVGAYKGRSTWYLAEGLRDAGSPHRVISIDPHLDPGQREAYSATLREHGLSDIVEPRIGFSHSVAAELGDRNIGMLWIDGDHSYRSVKQDFDDWFPRLIPGGWYAMHDTVNAWYGPTRLARELLNRHGGLTDIGVVWLTLFGRKAIPAAAIGATLRARIGFEALTLMQARHSGFGPQRYAPGER